MSTRRPSTPRVRVPRPSAGPGATADGAAGPGDTPPRPAPGDPVDDGDSASDDAPGTAGADGPAGEPAGEGGTGARTGRRRRPGSRRGASTRPGGPSAAPEAVRRPMISLRALGLLLAVVVALAVLYPTIRHAVAQREELRSLAAQVEDARARTEALERQQRLWTDPEYVRAQARDRLGYVVPGERTFVVVDPQTVTGTVEHDDADLVAQAARERAATSPWYLTVWESVNIAGAAPVDAADQAVGAGDEPRPAPTPSEVAPPPGVESPSSTEQGDE